MRIVHGRGWAKSLRVAAFAAGALWGLVGCASTTEVQGRLAASMQAGDYASAIQILEEEREAVYSGRNRLLYHLERGMLLHFAGRHAESNESFELAKRIGDDLYSESVSNVGFSLLSNDFAIDYAGEDFERTLIHLFAALNYEQLGQPDSALVEVRQVGEYLRKLEVDSGSERAYEEDAFARYLSALFYEEQGELDAAFVDYKRAVDAYADYGTEYSVSLPSSLLPKAARLAERLGGWAIEDLDALGVSTTPADVTLADGSMADVPVADVSVSDVSLSDEPDEPPELPVGIADGTGEIVILHYNGLAPVKGETRYTIPFSQAWGFVLALQASADDETAPEINRATAIASQLRGVDVISVAFPKYVDRPYSIVRMAPNVDQAIDTTGPELVEDIGAIAEKDLADRIARVRAKTFARAAIKYAIQKAFEETLAQAGGDYGQLLRAAAQVAGNVARYATERADTRVWSTLPDQIWMSTVVVPPGTHQVSVDFLDAQQGVVETRDVPDLTVAAGERRFVILRTVQ